VEELDESEQRDLPDAAEALRENGSDPVGVAAKAAEPYGGDQQGSGDEGDGGNRAEDGGHGDGSIALQRSDDEAADSGVDSSQRIKDSEHTIERLKKELRVVEWKRGELERKIISYGNLMEGQVERLQAAQREDAGTIEQLQQEIKSLEASRREAPGRSDTLAQDMEDTRQDLHWSQNEVTKLGEQMKKLQEQCDAALLERGVDSPRHSGEVAMLRQQLEELRGEMQEQSGELARATEENTVLRRQVEEQDKMPQGRDSKGSSIHGHRGIMVRTTTVVSWLLFGQHDRYSPTP
jgi:DNA repair exonuclease SbcCD ATPase subunit